jgi:hypothetical protein
VGLVLTTLRRHRRAKRKAVETRWLISRLQLHSPRPLQSPQLQPLPLLLNQLLNQVLNQVHRRFLPLLLTQLLTTPPSQCPMRLKQWLK